jgi:hypothetical protein
MIVHQRLDRRLFLIHIHVCQETLAAFKTTDDPARKRTTSTVVFDCVGLDRCWDWLARACLDEFWRRELGRNEVWKRVLGGVISLPTLGAEDDHMVLKNRFRLDSVLSRIEQRSARILSYLGQKLAVPMDQTNFAFALA